MYGFILCKGMDVIVRYTLVDRYNRDMINGLVWSYIERWKIYSEVTIAGKGIIDKHSKKKYTRGVTL